MLRIEPTITQTFKQNSLSADNKTAVRRKDKADKNMLALSLAGLAAAGLTAIGLKKTHIISYEEALKKNGVEIKDGIATLIKSGKKYTGKIERFEKRNRKETVEFVDGTMTEKLYYTAFGKEIDGYFYKGDACYHNSRYGPSLSIGGKPSGIKFLTRYIEGPFFEETRKYVASPDFDKLVQRTKEAMLKSPKK